MQSILLDEAEHFYAQSTRQRRIAPTAVRLRRNTVRLPAGITVHLHRNPHTDPSQPIGDIKEAWEGAKRRTRRHCPECVDGILMGKSDAGYLCGACHWETAELPVGLFGVRFHDLRHSAVSRMISAGVPLPIIAKIVGWSDVAKMAARYGHFGIEELRTA